MAWDDATPSDILRIFGPAELGRYWSIPWTKNIIWDTGIVNMSEIQKEDRLALYESPDRSWEFTFNMLNTSTRQLVIDFFDKVRGGGCAFWFSDPDDHDATCTLAYQEINIICASSVDNSFQVSGDWHEWFKVGTRFQINGTTNSGLFICLSDSYYDTDTLRTTILVTEDLDDDPEFISGLPVSQDEVLVVLDYPVMNTYYSGDPGYFSEQKMDIVVGSVVVVNNNGTLVENADYVVAYTGGFIRLNPALAVWSSMTITCEFYYRVTTGDTFEHDYIASNFWKTGTLTLEEVKRNNMFVFSLYASGYLGENDGTPDIIETE